MQTKLKYIGGGNRWIMMIAMRDLTDYDLETYSDRDGTNIDELTDQLLASGLYELRNSYICPTCGKNCKTEKALIKHELSHIAEEDNQDDNSINSI